MGGQEKGKSQNMYDLMGMAEFVNPSPSDTNSLPASEVIPESTKGTSHLLTGDDARIDQLTRLDDKITLSDLGKIVLSPTKLSRMRHEQAQLKAVINRNAGGLPSQQV